MMKTALTITVAVLLLCCLCPHSSAAPALSDPGSGANVPGNPPMQTYPIVLQINLVPDVKGKVLRATQAVS
ncbi:hypothetical protein V1264_014337 [Littorina saxatilis]|uniref:Uncharacterized protein n=1 Tax=Littorina saxatilis TaxID=31220 RepID=A0AAN9BSN6_9CAEN